MADEAPAAVSRPENDRASAKRRLAIAAIVLSGGALTYGATRGTEPVAAPVAATSATPSPPPVTPLLDAVPRDVMLLATVDLGRLRSTRVYAMLRASGLAPVEEARTQCAIDPLERLSEVGFLIPATGSAGDFGIVASGGLGADEVLACTGKILESRNGRALVSTLGSFRTTRDAASARVGELAVRDGGPVMIGAGAFLRTMADTADRALPSVRESKVHGALRDAVGKEAVATVTAILTEEQRAVVRDEARSLADAGPPWVEAILAVGAGVRVDGDRALLHGVALVDGGRADEVSRALGALLAGTPYAGRVRLVPEGSSVHAYVEADLDELGPILAGFPSRSPALNPK